MKAAIVTGATGFLGGAVARKLLWEGWRVYALGRNVEALTELSRAGAEIKKIDLTNSAAMHGFAQQIQGINVQAIVHCAAKTGGTGSPSDFRRDNLEATVAVCRLARSLPHARIIHISTPSIYIRPSDAYGLKEDDAKIRPIGAYATSKWQAERFVAQRFPYRALILRPRGIYGPGDSTLLPPLIEAAQKGPLPRFRQGATLMDLTYIDDVVAAVRAAIQLPAARLRREAGAQGTALAPVFNISGGEALPLYEVITHTCARSGVDVAYRDMGMTAARIAAFGMELAERVSGYKHPPLLNRYLLSLLAYSNTLDISRARDVLGWTPQVSFEEGFENTFPH